MKKTTEYNVDIETYSGTNLGFCISLTKKELKALEALVDEKDGNFYIGAFNQIIIEVSRFTAFDLINAWDSEDRLTLCDFSYCDNCDEYTSDADPCCGAGLGDDYEDEEDEYENDEDEDEDY